MGNTFEINLPFFLGFYETPYCNWDYICDDVEENQDEYRERFGLSEDDEIDGTWIHLSKDYYDDVCKSYCSHFLNFTPDFVTNVEFVELVSPRYYNFETDKIYANVTMTDDWRDHVLKFMKDNEESLREVIRKDWSSRDGFISFMSNDYDEWVEEFKKDEPDRRYISTMLGYIMRENYDDDLRYDLCCYVTEDVSPLFYITYDKPNLDETPNIGVG